MPKHLFFFCTERYYWVRGPKVRVSDLRTKWIQETARLFKGLMKYDLPLSVRRLCLGYNLPEPLHSLGWTPKYLNSFTLRQIDPTSTHISLFILYFFYSFLPLIINVRFSHHDANQFYWLNIFMVDISSSLIWKGNKVDISIGS